MREQRRESRRSAQNRFGKGGIHNFIHSGRQCPSEIFLKDLPPRTSRMPSVGLLLSSHFYLSDGFVYHLFLNIVVVKGLIHLHAFCFIRKKILKPMAPCLPTHPTCGNWLGFPKQTSTRNMLTGFVWQTETRSHSAVLLQRRVMAEMMSVKPDISNI